MDIQIVHVVLGKANPNRMNGVNKVVNSLSEFQTKLGYEVTVWGITKNPVKDYPPRIYNTILFKDVSKFWLDKAIDTALINQPLNTIFHIHGAFIPQFYVLAKKIEYHGFSYVYTPHGAYNTVALERSAIKKRVYIKFFEKVIVKYAKSVHFIGESEVEGAKRIFGNIPYTLIPNGQNIDDLRFNFKSIKKNNFPVFGFVGRIDIKTKGLDILLKGYALYAKRKQNLSQLWVVGDGKELPALKKMAKDLGIFSRIKFLGCKFGQEKLNIIANMDYLCLTSRNEGLPGVVLEAASLRVPCIVSRATNMVNYIQENYAGFYLEENTPDELAKTLSMASVCYRYKDTNYYGENARKMVKNLFSWNNISKQLIEEYGK